MTMRFTTDLPSTHQTQICKVRSWYAGKRTHEPKFVQNNTHFGDAAMSDQSSNDSKQAEQDLRKQEQADKFNAEQEVRKQEQADKRS
jgi:hypothetical protein